MCQFEGDINKENIPLTNFIKKCLTKRHNSTVCPFLSISLQACSPKMTQNAEMLPIVNFVRHLRRCHPCQFTSLTLDENILPG